MNYKKLYRENGFGPSEKNFGFNALGPYSFAELDDAASLIKADDDLRWRCIHLSVVAAKQYLIATQVQSKTKTAARDNLSDIETKARDLLTALRSMSAEAIGALYENAKEKGDLEARPHVWLAESIQDYLCWQHGALAIAEESAGSGARRKNDNLRRLCKAMHTAFVEAVGSDQGFYKFFRAMITPLVREGLPKNKTQGDAETFRQRWREISRE